MPLIRYEVEMNDGKREGIFVAPFTNKQVTEEEVKEYWDLLDRLHSPDLTEEVAFYFTPRGDLRFQRVVEIMFKAVPKDLEPKLHRIVLERAKRGQVVYRDHYQVALKKEI